MYHVDAIYLRSYHWRHNHRDSVSNHRRLDCLLNRLFPPTSKRTSKLRVTGLCEWNSPVTGEIHSPRASNVQKDSIWWRHYDPWRRYDSMVQKEQWSQFIYAEPIVPSAIIWRHWNLSVFVLLMAWCRQDTSHYLNQCWPSIMSPYGVSGPQWVKATQGIPVKSIRAPS